ncbi:MAG: FlgD immunoglobulin-like domain containing protein [Nitrospinota bacterium]
MNSGPASTVALQGYHVYRSTSPGGSYTKIAGNIHLPQSSEVTLTVNEMQEHVVCMLDIGKKCDFYHAAKWDGRNEHGLKVTSGICFYQIEIRSKDAGQRPIVAVKKMILIK